MAANCNANASKTKTKKKHFVAQKVKLFRASEPLLSVLMWGVNHTNFDIFAASPEGGPSSALLAHVRFSHVIAVIVYIPPRADATVACDVINSAVAKLKTQHPEALVLISGDFNHVSLDKTLPAVSQYVDCNTRGNRTIDLLYANVKDAYAANPLPSLGKADRTLVLLQPQYKSKARICPHQELFCSCRMSFSIKESQA